MSGLVERHFNSAEPVDLAALWKDLGISLVAGRIALDDSAQPLAGTFDVVLTGRTTSTSTEGAVMAATEAAGGSDLLAVRATAEEL